ncbi:MAG: cation transporter [Cytophagales bacterium]|nr:cation transporter [Bernardetiaceae bacterium]MDW8205820.1 cation transporter [Cytophagales bacterium]
MYRTVFKVEQMDCPAEVQLIRMKLAPLKQIQHMEFDIANRTLAIWHSGERQPIESALTQLQLGSAWQSSEQLSEQVAHLPFAHSASQQQRLLATVLTINLLFFIVELLFGILAGSMGLLADGLDMLADSIVYGMALFATGSTVARKRQIAHLSGYFQLILAILGLWETLRRFWGWELTPDFQTMIVVSLFALIGNAASLYLLQKNKSREAHMQASLIFTANDVVVNAGVIVAGILVGWLQSKVPDLIIGLIVFAMVARGAFRILKL